MKHYPLPIQEKVKEVIFSLREDNFFEKEEVKDSILEEILSESLLPKFISGEELTWEYDEIEHLLKLSIVNTVIERLKAEGYVNSVEDETGEEWLWATEKGKEELENQKRKKRKTKKRKT